MNKWEKQFLSKAKEFARSYWENWYERELAATEHTCMHSPSGEHNFKVRVEPTTKMSILICENCSEMRGPI